MEIVGLEELQRAVKRNPQLVVSEVGKFLVRGIAVYNRKIIREPWRVGSNGGGAPTGTGNLRDTHQKSIQKWEASITATAPYAQFVHDGTYKMKARPWLDYAKQTSENEIQKLEEELLTNIVKDLAN